MAERKGRSTSPARWSGAEKVAVMLTLVLWVFGVTPLLRVAALLAALIFSCHLFWTWRRVGSWSALRKGIIVAVLITAYVFEAAAILFPPPTFAYLVVGRSMGENSSNAPREMIPRRAFVIRQRGPAILHHVAVTLHDNYGDQNQNDYLGTYDEIDPGPLLTGAEPLHFWFQPSKAWDEDYTIAITSREANVSERLHIECTKKSLKLSFALLVTNADGKVLLACKDRNMSAPPKWTVESPACDSLIPAKPAFGAELEPRPFAIVVFPNQAIDMEPRAYESNTTHPIAIIPACGIANK